MARTADLDRVVLIVLRQMRGPVLLLIVIYAVGISVMALLPGSGPDGGRMSLFHAFYFLTYTTTTTGFGEIPEAFSELQRLWAIFCLFMGVIGWLYAVGSIIQLVQNPHFRQALAEQNFAHNVTRIAQPFFIVCGFGDTGSLLARGLSDEGWVGVIIDSEPDRIKALGLRDYQVTMVGTCADASVPRHLLDAGIQHPLCRGVVALTNNEHINLKIAVMARFLNPAVRVVSRSTDPRHQEELAMLDSMEVVDPFDSFARQLSAAVHVPLLNVLTDWLIGARDVDLNKPPLLPRGTWILCGYGRMGRHLHEELRKLDIPLIAIDPKMEDADTVKQKIIGHTTDKTLRQARIEQAVGIVAGTDSDSNNLSILLRARALNKEIFRVVRQNRHEHEIAFNAANAHLIMQPSLVTARRILLMLIAPLIAPFLEYLRQHHVIVLESLVHRLKKAVGDDKPQLWTTEITSTDAMAVASLQRRGYAVTVGDICRSPADRKQLLGCVPMVLARDKQIVMLPQTGHVLELGDHILFCGTLHAQRLLEATLNNHYTLHYLITGTEEPRSYFFRWLERRRSRVEQSQT
ncbi:MAG: NAD-binding protein [Candidatus Competibacteraceae bacterium]|jgi:Trk K+ transport system NAD-binding subunit|nr:NAD-binding protein [Candidatus Competibacteraceae bacterium]